MASARVWKPPTGTHNVKIGSTMQAALDSLDGPASASCLTEYYSVNYDYRPPALDMRAPGKMNLNGPQSEGLPSFKMQYGSAEAGDLQSYAGTQTQAKDFECVLIYDEVTGEFTFERLDSVISLAYDRASSSSSASHHAAAATSRPLDNSPGTVSSLSPPTPPNVTYNGFDNVQVATFDDLEEGEETAAPIPAVPKSTPAAPQPSRPSHAGKSVMMVTPPERPGASGKGKGKRNRDSLAEKDPPPRQPPAKRLPAAGKSAPPPPPPALPSAPLALPSKPTRPPTPPSGVRSPNAFQPYGQFPMSDDEDEDIPLSAPPPAAPPTFSGDMLEIDENPVLPPPRALIEEEAPDIDGMFDESDEEDGDGEGEEEDEEEDDFRIDVDEPDTAPVDPNAGVFGGEEDDEEEDDDDDDDDDDSDEDSD